MLVPNTLSISPTARTSSGPTRAPEQNPTLAKAFGALAIEKDCEWARANYKRTVIEFCKQFSAHRLIEIGGGRDPLFSQFEVDQLDVEMTINDISRGELAVLPQGYSTACFDIAGDTSSIANFRNFFDFAFSQMVFEHVADGQRAWSNLYDVLKPGGVALAYMPTLFAFPFVANWLLPDKLAAMIAKILYKNRTDDDDPVFPARYSWCFTDARLAKMLSAIGYREVFVQPFYGHGYYKIVPALHKIQLWFAEAARRNDWRPFSSFAYVAVRK